MRSSGLQSLLWFWRLQHFVWPGVTFTLRNVLRATMACTFSSLIWPDGSAPVALASLLFDPPEPHIIGKTQCFAPFLPFRAPASSFLFLFSDLLSSSLLFSLWLFPPLLFHLSILSEVWLLNFLRLSHLARLFHQNSCIWTCAMVKIWYMGDGHPTNYSCDSRDNEYINPCCRRGWPSTQLEGQSTPPNLTMAHVVPTLHIFGCVLQLPETSFMWCP